ncbi:hypothetical protein [Prolixibacter sp. NT017]|uniref:hypothetical protein n=1 Tax=Prolixibacter sp. NT017 TaxID=2652390 RepID=UPI0012857475|nr:hypothetical protein [Prolixibacter sp. NT017]GET25862.1 hypothetical protein NT017_21910 [Prolixibacter sp. NT017]
MSIKEKKRFQDTDWDISQWQKVILVKCPNCGKRAEINHKRGIFSPFFEEGINITCSNCSYNFNENLYHYRLEVDRNCGNCGEKIKRIIPNLKTKKETIRIKCDNCGETQNFKPSYSYILRQFQNQDGEKDKIFGLSLWLQESIKNEILWAYNYDHLKFLKSYIEADLRESYGMTLSAKLPKFIKDKKNRDKLLKLIDKMWNKK